MHAMGVAQGDWDGARMSQVFANLLSNAAQHGAPGSPVSVELIGESEEVVIIVHNFGNVIPSSEIFGIFSPFKRLKPGAPASRDSTNLGLGLFISDRIVKAHAGTIDVQSSFDEGTSFTVHLPRNPDAPPAPLRATSRTDRRASDHGSAPRGDLA
jgi:signal transduction histidine kinase